MATGQPAGLIRSLSLLDITMVGIAAMIAGSIFNLIGPAMYEAGPALLVAFAFSGIISFFTALTYAELGSAFPEAGGGYRWVREGLPRPNAFISGWTAWFAHMIAGSLYAVSFGSFFGSLLTSIGVSSNFGGIPLQTIIAAIAVIIFTYVNYRGVSLTGKVGNGLTITQLAIIISIIAAGLFAWGFVNHNWTVNFQNFVPKGVVGLILAMGRQYNLPYIFSSIHPKYHTPHFAIIASGFIMLVMAAWLPIEQLALAAGVLFLFLFTQVNWAGIQIRRLYGHKLDYGFKIPLFPIMPVIGICAKVGLAVFLLIYNPLSWAIAIVWILIGFSIYKLYIAKKEIEHYAPLVANEGPSHRKDYRIMVVFNKKTAEKLVKIASAIAKDKNGEISLLSIVTIPIQIPLSMGQGFAETTVKSVGEIKHSLPQSSDYRYLIRLTHDTTEVILATVEEQGINLLVMDFYDLRNNRKLLSLTTCDILGVHIKKEFEKEISNLVVSYDKGRHSDLGLEIAHSFSNTLGSKIRIIRGVVESPEEERDILSRINEKMFDLDLRKVPVERVYTTSLDITKDLLQNLNQKPEIVIVGAGNQADQAFSPKTIEIVEKSLYSVFVVRNSRLSSIKARYFWHMIAPRLMENRIIYKIYRMLLKLVTLRKKTPSPHEDYFAT